MAGRDGMSSRQILQQQDETMRQQDDILGEIEAGVGNLKDYGLKIGNEADLHVKLLNEMDGDVSEAQEGLMAETDRATQVRKASGNCRLYLCIILLLVVLIALLVMG